MTCTRHYEGLRPVRGPNGGCDSEVISVSLHTSRARWVAYPAGGCRVTPRTARPRVEYASYQIPPAEGSATEVVSATLTLRCTIQQFDGGAAVLCGGWSRRAVHAEPRRAAETVR